MYNFRLFVAAFIYGLGMAIASSNSHWKSGRLRPPPTRFRFMYEHAEVVYNSSILCSVGKCILRSLEMEMERFVIVGAYVHTHGENRGTNSMMKYGYSVDIDLHETFFQEL